MDILIKNMEIPKEGGLVIEITKHGQVAQLFKDGSLLRKGCKAIQLPPHGRLGDLDKLANVVDSSLTDYDRMIGTFDNILDMIESAPTVIPASEGE